MLVTNIQWDVDEEIIFDIVTDEPPREVEVPDSLELDNIADWLSDEYGYLVKGFVIKDGLTWDDIYERADGVGCGDWRLKAKDEARWQVRCFAIEHGEEDLEEYECPEDGVETYCNMFGIIFDMYGDIIKTNC